jgi:hypothetical protein
MSGAIEVPTRDRLVFLRHFRFYRYEAERDAGEAVWERRLQLLRATAFLSTEISFGKEERNDGLSPREL